MSAEANVGELCIMAPRRMVANSREMARHKIMAEN